VSSFATVPSLWCILPPVPASKTLQKTKMTMGLTFLWRLSHCWVPPESVKARSKYHVSRRPIVRTTCSKSCSPVFRGCPLVSLSPSVGSTQAVGGEQHQHQQNDGREPKKKKLRTSVLGAQGKNPSKASRVATYVKGKLHFRVHGADHHGDGLGRHLDSRGTGFVAICCGETEKMQNHLFLTSDTS
jgi:hypothetical protein